MSNEDREIVIQRTIAAPRELVWRAFTEVDQIGEWWGPNGFTTTTHEMDVRVGGSWRYIMHGPDGTDYENKITYTELVEPESMAYDHGDFESVHFKTSVTFVEVAGSTEVTLRAIFENQAARDAATQFGAVEGGSQTLARLAELLEK